MSYFGGYGGGRGYWKLQFLVAPDLLRQIFDELRPVLVTLNSPIAPDYNGMPYSEYIAAYSRYLEAMFESAEAAWRADVSARTMLSSSLGSFVRVSEENSGYKLVLGESPVAHLRPLTLHYDAQRGQLSTNTHSYLYFGMELSFPRVISLAKDKHEQLYDTTNSPTYGLVEQFKRSITKATKACVIRSPSREHRTQIRIDQSLRERVKNHPGLNEAALQVV